MQATCCTNAARCSPPTAGSSQKAQQRHLAAAPLALHRSARRQSVAAAAGPEKPPPEQLPYTDRPAEVPSSDPWEGEQFEAVGKLASWAIPIIAVAAVGIGLFATSTYNEGATVFLDAPKSEQDSAKLITADQLMMGPPPAQQ